MPSSKRPTVVKRAVTIRLPEDLISRIEDESIADGRAREKGRVYSPSATIERILRAYFESRPIRGDRKK